jgi:light-regulated signal transduction histidine kinase (bacteriophytochrome)
MMIAGEQNPNLPQGKLIIDRLEGESIDLYDFIQPRGALLVLEEGELTIVKVSDNSEFARFN